MNLYPLSSVDRYIAKVVLVVGFLLTFPVFANHGDQDPICPDVEVMGEATVQFNNLDGIEYIDLPSGETTYTLTSDATATGQCEWWIRDADGICYQYLTDDAYVKLHIIRSIWDNGWEQNVKVVQPGSTSSTISHDFQVGEYHLRVINHPHQTNCSLFDEPSVSDYVDLYVETVPPKEEYACSSSGNKEVSDDLVGNPCNASSGNKHQRELDYKSPFKGLSIVRYYNSAVDNDYGMGMGWTAGFLKRLDFGTKVIRSRRGGGGGEAFVYDDGSWKAGDDGTMRISQDANGYTITRADGGVETYSSIGNLLTESANGYTLIYSYNASGGLQSVTNSFGHTMSLTYNVEGRIETITTPGGGLYQYGYDSSGNLISVMYPDQSIRQYHYENAEFPNALTGVTDENGDRFSTFGYKSGSGWAILTEHAITDNGQPQEQYQLDYRYSDGRHVIVTGPTGNITTLDFSKILGVKRLKKSTKQLDGKYKYLTYDVRGNVLTKTDEEGRKTTYTYNSTNQRITMTEANNTAVARTTTYEYLTPTENLITKVVTPSVKGGEVSEVVTGYDANRNITSITKSGLKPDGTTLGREITFQYSVDGQIIQVDGPRTDVSDVVTMDYYNCSTGSECGRLRSATNALNQVTTYSAYDADGRVTQMTSPNGVVTDYTYDSRGRVATVTQTPPVEPSGVTTYSYTPAGQIESVTDPLGVTVTYTYDAAHDLKVIRDSLGNEIRYRYDVSGNRTDEDIYDPQNVLKYTVDKVYDIRNRIDTINVAGNVTDLLYDAVGNLVEETDPNGNTTSHNYDPLDRLTSTIDALTGQANYDYDVADQMAQVVDPNGNATTYSRDDLGNIISMTSPDTGTTEYQYDAAGNLTQKTNANGVTVQYSYDELNRLTTINYPGGALDVNLTYDNCANGVGRLCGMTDGSGQSLYSYDGNGNLDTKVITIGTETLTLGFAYNNNDQLTQLTYPSGRTVDYARDVLGQVSQISTTSPDGQTTTVLADNITYQPFGPMASLDYGNGLALTRSFDLGYRLTGQAAGLAQDLSYSYDSNSNITAIADGVASSRSQTFIYDALNRLTSANGAYGDFDYTYDPNGNRKTFTQDTITDSYTYATDSNQLLNDGTKAYSHDSNGNVIDNTDYVFTYDDTNRLTAVEDGGVNIAAFAYNGIGERVKKVGQTTTLFTYGENGRLLAESGSSGETKKEYVYLNATPVALIDTDSNAQSSIYYVHTNHLDTPVMLTDSSQQVVWDAIYKPFGEVGLPTEQVSLNIRFPGQYFDEELGLHYNYYRDYDPSLGRYTQSDPIGLEGGINTYSYALNNPLYYKDPIGLDVICGQNAVWIPDSSNPGDGHCRPFRDQGPQCFDGSCAAYSEGTNTKDCMLCVQPNLEDCVMNNSGSLGTSCAACALSPNKAQCFQCALSSGGTLGCYMVNCSYTYKNCHDAEEGECK